MISENQTSTKVSGYLEKKGKLRIGSAWKKYWFVLEGRLLLYYRSKDEYDAIRPCKGSVSLCPPCNVKPSQTASCAFQIECRFNSVTLRAENRSEQERWMQAIMISTAQSQSTSNRMNHFRYSLDDLPTQAKQNKEVLWPFSRQYTLPHRFKSPKKDRKQILDKLNSLGNQSFTRSTGTLNGLPKEKYAKSPRLPKNKNLGRLLEHNNSVHGVANRLRDMNGDLHLNKSQSYEESVNSSNEKQKPIEKGDGSWGSDDYLIKTKIKGSITSLTQVTIPEENEDIKKNINDNDGYLAFDVNGISEELGDCRKDSLKYAYGLQKEPEALYEDLDKIKDNDHIYSETESRRKTTGDFPNQNSSIDGRSKIKENKFKFLMKLVKSEKKVEGPKRIVRHSSFIRKMLKISKSEESETEKNVSGYTPEKVEGSSREKSIHSIGDSQMLLQLQKIAESRKHSLKKSAVEADIKTEIMVKESPFHENRLETNPCTTSAEEEKPTLPPRQNARPTSPYHDTPRVSRPCLSTVARTRKSEDSNNYGTIDDILNDLEKQKRDEDRDVWFIRNGSEDVVLRKKSKVSEEGNQARLISTEDVGNQTECVRGQRHSSDLGRLLEELGKITSAPVLAPGITCSLVTPETITEEWLKMLPIRRRRMSDPDYDVPRPHSSLQLHNYKKVEVENPIPATRFFGPVLQIPPDMPSSEPAISWNNMDPDSLETDRQPNIAKEYYRSNDEWEHDTLSYSSHEYNHHHCKHQEGNVYCSDYYYQTSNTRKQIVKDNVKHAQNNDANLATNRGKGEFVYQFREMTEKHMDSIRKTLGSEQEHFIDSLEISTAL